MVSLNKLKSEGYKVKVVHLRRVFSGRENTIGELKTRNQILNDFGTMDVAFLTGGETRVYIKSPDGKESSAVSRCSDKDSFNRKRGLEIALGRAFNNL